MIFIDKITLAVGHMDETKQFYASVLGLTFHPIAFAGRELFTASLGNMEMLLCPKDLAGIDADINTIQLRFVIDDVEHAYQRALEGGGTEISGVQEVDGRAHVSVRDPEGNSLELIAPAMHH